jgi:hypothetical protein
MKMILRKRKKQLKENPLRDKVAGKIAGGLLTVQTKFSDKMNKIFSTMKVKRMKLWLILFCFISGGLSIYFFIDALVAKPKTSIKIDNVKMPQHFDKSGDEIMQNPVPDEMYRNIQDYKKYMDSIGEPIRPGLLDSIKILEELYLSTKK